MNCRVDCPVRCGDRCVHDAHECQKRCVTAQISHVYNWPIAAIAPAASPPLTLFFVANLQILRHFSWRAHHMLQGLHPDLSS
jgi:hypothetical protein